MDNPNNQLDTTNSGASTDDVDINSEAGKIKIEAVNNAATFAMRGKKTHKDIDEGISSESSEYDWWENQGTYESNSWSVAYWRFADNTWKLQATRVELKSDGRSQMTSYSMRTDSDPNFPGFQVYKELVDDRYHPAKIEDIVYLDRVMKGLAVAQVAS